MAGLIDAYFSAPWYRDHMQPVLDALGPDAGMVYEGRLLLHRNQDPRRPILIASYGDLKIARTAGYKRFVLAQHGAGQSYGGEGDHAYPSYAGGRDHGDVGLFLVPNDHAAGRWRAAYPGASVAIVGCPKLDLIPRREPAPGLVVALSWHWDFRHAPELRSALYEFVSALPDLAARYKVLGHGHPKRIDLDRIYRRTGIERVTDFDEIARRADLYVCDNSSTIFEFAATGRPVVVLNSRHYRRNVELGLRFWSAACVGIQVDHYRGLIPAVERALECRPEDVAAREAALDQVYQPRTGGGPLAAAAIRAFA